MTKIIGLTGGIGSGKTTVANEFKKLGVPVYIADLHAKKIMEQPQTLLLLKESFGTIIFKNEKLDREALSKIVFDDPDKLSQLNKIIHPLVQINFEDWLATRNKIPFIIKEAAILFETGSYKDCDSIILITAPIETRIQRIQARDGTNRNLILKKIASQMPDEEKIKKSDFIIENVDIASTIEQVHTVFNLLND